MLTSYQNAFQPRSGPGKSSTLPCIFFLCGPQTNHYPSIEAPLHGNLSTFGKAAELSFGASDVNPNNYLSNCVSVTMAKNLGYTNVHKFWKDIYGYDLPDVPLTFPQIIELGKRTGWKCSWVAY